ncbi:LacI family transcriptional regulator [Amylibacter kogurei]|uniref:LacI family transcriptional regulator n=1 Tax=Paramylibacter kogurei TaxID=1889778 RepID=A0A2G5KAT2_9RHOB|nr:LacI family DNA-binding transcriptional regulator [Amylibacter kogurei]PIB25734.1 LacI family transcriptional regulator [Amylibacter kogurei]
MQAKTAKIQDVARIAGVSTATVSRALSNPDLVAESTRNAVMDAVAESGYRINHTARNLRRQRSGSILALVPNLANPFFSQILAGLSSVLSPAGYGLLIADTQTDNDPQERLRHFIQNGLADGIVIFDGNLPKQELLPAQHPPIVLACEWVDFDLPSVRVDNAKGAQIAIQHLYDLGHRQIGHITGPNGNVLAESRLQGMKSALAALNLQQPDQWVFQGDYSMDSGAFAAKQWMALDNRPTAVFSASDEMACGFMGALQHAGIDVPRDVSVIGFDNIEVVEHLTPALTTIRQPRRLIGQHAGQMVIKMIDDATMRCPSELIPVELIIRNSVVAPKT